MIRLLSLLCLLFSLAACGKQGDLQPPSGAEPFYPRQYPAPAAP